MSCNYNTKFYKKNNPQKNERFGYHFVQSFLPDDHLTPEHVHEIGLKTMKAYLGGSAEFIIGHL
ncbi:relaxase/mobilization nuclease domain-containing protein [Lactococcus lactis]|uniref:relaxase/mobilization nuclease domain-containing protein n=1 Tax=Lactococcus lactis TaxID=1358 RepID=UPI003D123A2A